MSSNKRLILAVLAVAGAVILLQPKEPVQAADITTTTLQKLDDPKSHGCLVVDADKNQAGNEIVIDATDIKKLYDVYNELVDKLK